MPCLKSSWRAVTSRPPVGCWARIYKSFCRPSRWDRGEEITNNWRGCKYVFFFIFLFKHFLVFSLRFGVIGSCATAPSGIHRRLHETTTSGTPHLLYLTARRDGWPAVCYIMTMFSVYSNFRPPGTPWSRLATLINLLSRFDTRQVEISNKSPEGKMRFI